MAFLNHQLPIEEDGGYIDPRWTLQLTSTMGGHSGDLTSSRTPSQSSQNSSQQFLNSFGATDVTTPDGRRGSNGSVLAFPTAGTTQDIASLGNDPTGLSGMGTWSAPDGNFPSSIDDLDVPGLNGEGSHSIAMNGLTSSHLDNMHQAAYEIFATVASMQSTGRYSLARLLQTQRRIRQLGQDMGSVIEYQMKSASLAPSVLPQPPGPDPPVNQGNFYRCPKCPDSRPREFRDDYAFIRHINDTHHPKVIFRCPEPGCPMTKSRRYRMINHINAGRGGHSRPEKPGEIDANTVSVPHETWCSICGGLTGSWNEFYDCFIKHCKINPCQPNGDSRDRLDGDNLAAGTGDDLNNESLLDSTRANPLSTQGLSAAHRNLDNATEQRQFPSHLTTSQDAGIVVGMPSVFPEPQQPSTSQFPIVARRPCSEGNALNGEENVRRSVPDRVPFRTQQPNQWPSRSVNPFNTTDRTRRVGPGKRHHRRCRRCRHRFRDCSMYCSLRYSTDGCHACPNRSAVPAPSHSHPNHRARGSIPAGEMDSQMIIPLGTANPWNWGFDIFPQESIPSDTGFYQTNNIGGNFFNDMHQMMPDGPGDPSTHRRGNNQQVRAVLSIDGDVLHEQEMESASPLDPKAGLQKNVLTSIVPPWILRGGRNQQLRTMLSMDGDVVHEQEIESPFSLHSKAALQKSVLTSIIPLIDPFKKWLLTPIKSLSMASLSGHDFITETEEPPAGTATTNPIPTNECQCACRRRARAEFGPNRCVDLSLELSSSDGPEHSETHRANGHLLRVQIVVKLLSLRSMVATPDQNAEDALSLKQAFEPTLGETIPDNLDNETEDSDDDSEIDPMFSEDEREDDSLSSSLSDIRSLSPESPASSANADETSLEVVEVANCLRDERREEEVMVRFDINLQSALDRLSRWTGGSSGDVNPDLAINDPDRVLEYFVAYILHVIMTLARSRGHNQRRCLDN